MQIKTTVAAALLASFSLFQTPALAQTDERAQLRLTVVDETNAPLPNAIVTVFTISGPRTVNTDEKGVVVFAGLPTSTTTEWWARTGQLSNAEATRLKAGENTRTITVHTAKSLTETERSESGS
jgi:hypothetical protein